MRINSGWIGLLLAAAILLGTQIAYAAFAYNNFTGPTIVQNNGNGTWNVQWTINVTTLSNPDKTVCVTAGAQTAVCGTGTGTLTCTLNNVSNTTAVNWSINTFTANNGCTGSASSGPSGQISPLAVELAAFSAAQQQAAIIVEWETTSELNHRGFNVWRSDNPDAPATRLNDLLIAPQSPGGAAGGQYRWEDSADLVAGRTYYYWLEALETGGAVEQYGPVAVEYRVPTAVKLQQIATTSTVNSIIWLGFLCFLLSILTLWQYTVNFKTGFKRRKIGHIFTYC